MSKKKCIFAPIIRIWGSLPLKKDNKKHTKDMKTRLFLRILLVIAIITLGYFCVMSVVTPIRFEETRAEREVAVIKNLLSLRIAQTEFKAQHGYYTADLDSLVLFLRNTPKKEVKKEGSLTDKQLEAGLTEHKAVKIIDRAKAKAYKAAADSQKSKKKNATPIVFNSEDDVYAYIWENDREIKQNGLQGFRRDTIVENMIETLYKGEYNAETIGEIIYIPYSNGLKYEVETNNGYTTSQGIRVPLIEIRAPYSTYLADQNAQELVNLIDKEQKLDHYPGLMIGSIDGPNNNAGNWE